MKLLHLPLLCIPWFISVADAAAPRPNILVVLTDDLGYSDLGCYGSEIETPTLDRLASNGLRFTQFYNTAKCHSSRVSLLSGRWCHQAGNTSLSRSVIIPEVLAPAGYSTAMVGKWHLKQQPTDFGFQRYFGHLSGACNYYRGDNSFRLNGEPWTVPDEGFYTTVTKVDFALRFLNEARTEKKPWFLYLAFNAPHAPLQPLKQDYEKYSGRYESGWDKIRAARLAKQKKLKLFGNDLEPSPRPDHIPAWDELIPEIREWESRRMTALAGMIDRIDQELGRLVADLEKAGELDNTLILFFSDNGACPYDRRNPSMDRQPYEPDVTWSDSTGWAWARNSPFRYYKQNQFEGGISTPAIAHWPAGIKRKPGSTVHSPAHLVDVLPTLAELGGAKVPTEFPGREPTPLAGTSLAPILAGEKLTQRPPIHLLFASDRGLRDGDWKLASIVERMSKEWHRMTSEVLMAPEKVNQPVAESATGHVHPEWSRYSGENGAVTSSRGPAAAKPKRAGATKGIRARRETKLEIADGELILTCETGDPGLAFDSLGKLAEPGPYKLSFQLKSQAGGDAELYFTTDPKTKLPNSEQITFDVTHDSKWHTITLDIPTAKTLHALRLDPCSTAGTVRIKALTLQTATGKTLRTWP